MLCFHAFGNVPYKDVAIMTRRQHYPGIKRMGLQDKYFIRMPLEIEIAHCVQTKGHNSTSLRYIIVQSKAVLSSPQTFGKLEFNRLSPKTHGLSKIPQ